jgi:hypothetical protein
VKCRLPPTYSAIIHVELVRFISGQPENVAVVPRASHGRQQQAQMLGPPAPPPPVLPLAPPGVGSKGAPPPTVPGPVIYSHPKGPPIGPPPGAVSYGNISQYPSYMVPEDGPSSNGIPPHKKRKLPEPDENVAAPPPHKRPIRTRTPSTAMPAMAPHAAEPSSHYDHFLGASHIIPGQSQPMYGPSRGHHRPRSPPQNSSHGRINGEYSHDPQPNMAPPGPPIHSFPPTSSTPQSQPYSNGHSRPSGSHPPRHPQSPRVLPNSASGLSTPAGNEVAPPSAPPIRKVKLVVKRQDKPAGDASLPPE